MNTQDDEALKLCVRAIQLSQGNIWTSVQDITAAVARADKFLFQRGYVSYDEALARQCRVVLELVGELAK